MATSRNNTKIKTLAGSNISKIPGTEIESEWLFVTAEQMAKWLRFSDEEGVNRNLNELHVRRLMNDMQHDRWAHTHQGLAFDTEGMLRDGQHRGTAQVRLGQDRWWLVTRGLPAASQHHMDSMRRRGVQDFTGGRNRNIRAAAARTIRAFELVQPHITEGKVRDVMRYMTVVEVIDETAPEMLEKLDTLAPAAYTASKQLNAFSASSILAAAAFLLTEEEALEWMRGFSEMSNLREGDPRIALMKIRGAHGRRLDAYNERILALRCAQAWKSGEEIKVLKPSLVHAVHAVRVGHHEPTEVS